MIINGKEIPQHVIDLCEARMMEGPFRARALSDIAATNGVWDKYGINHRVADRLIQKHRKAGNIHLLTNVTWVWRVAK